MATAQKQRNSLSAVIFPNKISTEQQSLVLVKRLLAIAVSCITYLRGIFPEYAYGTRYLDAQVLLGLLASIPVGLFLRGNRVVSTTMHDLCVKILKEDKNCPSSGQLVKWMLGCYDALQKKYLRLIVLAVYTNPEDPQTITECYQFKFKYTDKGPEMDFVSNHQGDSSNITCADTKKASILLLRKIYVLMQNLGPLPDDVCLTMKLFYYDEVTPPDYQPPGFKEGDCEEMVFEGEPIYLNVGEVSTPFHMLKVKMTTEKDRMEHVDRAILKRADLLAPPKTQQTDEAQDQKMDEDFITENKVREQKNAKEASRIRELNLTCEEDEMMKVEESQNLPIDNSQVDFLVSNTSELQVSEGRTRSGRRFQGNEGGVEKGKTQLAPKRSEERQKRHSLGSSKPVYNFEFSSSQDSGPKRRRFSEPKEQF